MEKGVSMPLECNIKRIETIIAENICLSEYLSGIEAFIDCSYKQINFAKYLSDINGYESYCYNEEEYSVDEENISIKNFVKDGKITFLKIPIITEDEESEFLKAYDVLEDYQEALDKIGNYEAINIWGDEDEFEECRKKSNLYYVHIYDIDGIIISDEYPKIIIEVDKSNKLSIVKK